MGLKKRLIRLSTATLLLTGSAVSPRLAGRVAGRLARHFKLDPRLNKRQLRHNLGRYFPERGAGWVETTARELQANAARAKIFDKHFLPRLATPDLDRMVEIVGLEHLTGALDAGRGAVCVSLHYGRFWAAPVWFSRHGYETTAFQSAGGSLPSQAATLSGGSFDATDPTSAVRAMRALKQGAVMFLILDAGRVPNPVTVEFLGQPTLFSTAAVRLARVANAAIVPILVPVHPDDPERVRITFYDPIDPRGIPADAPAETTIRRFLEPFEAQVRAAPSQWYGFLNAHRRMAPGGDGDEADV